MRKNFLSKCIAVLTASVFFTTGIGEVSYAAMSANTIYSTDMVEVNSSASILQSGGLLNDNTDNDSDLYGLSKASNIEGASQAILDAWDSCATSVNIYSYQISINDMNTLYGNLINENPKYFYVYPSCRYTYNPANNYVVDVTITYNYSSSEIQSKKALYETAVSKALAGLDSSWSDLEKALYINDYLTINCEYDTTYEKHSAYNALVEEKAVCQGYSLAFKDLANRVGLDCSIVTSESLNHAWNIVRVGNSYYHIDSTWNDPLSDMLGKSRHQYFLKSSDYFNSTTGKHTATDWIYSGDISDDCAGNTTYDDYFWNDTDTAFFNIDNNWYTVSSESASKYTLTKYSFNNNVLISQEDIHTLRGGFSWYKSVKIAKNDGKLYFNSPDTIYSVSLDTLQEETVYTLTSAEESIGSIFGFRIAPSGELYIHIASSPN